VIRLAANQQEETPVLEEDPMYSSRTVPELLRAIQYLLTVARGLEMKLTSDVRTGAPAPGQAPGFRYGPASSGIYTTKDHGKLVKEAQRLHDAVLREQRNSPGSPGLRRLRAHPQAEAIRQSVLADNSGARREAVARMRENDMSDTEGAAPAAPAKKTAKKAAKKAAKKVAKKAAPKKAKKAAGERAARTSYDLTKTFTWANGKDNPRRKGSAAYDRLEMLRRNSGKTLEKIVSLGGRLATVSNAVKMGLGKVA
jgi:hypothetical protein